MANYYATSRSNYFKVKDEAAFIAAMEKLNSLEVIHNSEGKIGIMVNDDCGAWPSFVYDEDSGEDEREVDIAEEVAEHLAEGEVAIFMTAGAEKNRYIVGYAECINWKFDRHAISLENIYDIAAGMTTKAEAITSCEY